MYIIPFRMTQLAHDSAASLRVEYRELIPGGGWSSRPGFLNGWYVVRTCPCHFGQRITKPFDSLERAERALMALDTDARKFS
jgi:hypothetical protein